MNGPRDKNGEKLIMTVNVGPTDLSCIILMIILEILFTTYKYCISYMYMYIIKLLL